MTCVKTSAVNTINEAAKMKNDHKLTACVDGIDLVAKEARHHESCRRQYVVRRPVVAQGVHLESGDDLMSKSARAAHEEAFNHIRQYVQKTLLRVGKLSICRC